ncbi:MAG: hypothetical protein PHS60_15390 [Zavarzinia sp.]|nr:hypothetical protein [Zavarzinia sp.]
MDARPPELAGAESRGGEAALARAINAMAMRTVATVVPMSDPIFGRLWDEVAADLEARYRDYRASN